MLFPHEPPPVDTLRQQAPSRLVLVCDHASNRIPERLGTLGLTPADLTAHIAWDIGAADVARHLSERFDAPLVLSGYSRLVIDMNRPHHVPTLIPEVTGGVIIPGNQGLTDADKALRIATFHAPYHAAIRGILDAKSARVRPILLAIHSFTPELLGQRRPWQIGMLYGKDTRIAHAFLAKLRRDPSLCVGDNEPYHVSADTDCTIPVHGEATGVLHTAIEIRQDGLATPEGRLLWAERIAAIVEEILADPAFSD